MIGSATDWIILIVVALVVLGGAKKIPELAKSLGRAKGEFDKGKKEVEKELEQIEK
jgi:sec-independent protein translocase protein TatA